MMAGCPCAGCASDPRSPSPLTWDWLVEHEGAEPHESFTFLERLHTPGCFDEGETTYWLGLMPYDHVGLPIVAVVLHGLNKELRGRTGWMPADEPYWHRASECANDKAVLLEHRRRTAS